jgi:chloramphenicol-sensitive protein RarD
MTGVLFALLAYTVWGILPLYWKLLSEVPASEVLAHRIIWSFVIVIFLIMLKKNWTELRQNWRHVLSSKKQMAALLSSAALISGNWLTYIWAVNSNRVIETSLGYYINPLLSVLLGVIVLKERLTLWQTLSFFLAAGGVAVATIHYGQIPWISLVLAITFALYGLAKKVLDMDSLSGLAFETLFALPFALIFVIGMWFTGQSRFGFDPVISLLLIGAGAATALPLLWFALAAKRISLSTLGFIQYVAPSITLCLGIFVFNEPFTLWDFISFALIWIALALYSLSRQTWMVRLEERLVSKLPHKKSVET